MNRPRVAYLSSDPGIPPDSSKGASVHFRELAAAFARIGVDLDVFLAREGDVSGFLPHQARTVPTPRGAGVEGEVLQIAHASALLAALRASGPHVAVYERLSLFGLAGTVHARSLGIPHLVEVNAPLWREAAAFRGLVLHDSARGICLDVVRSADRVLAVSHALADELADAGVRRDRLEVLGNGADLSRFRRATAAPKPACLRGRPTLLFLGSLKPWHGLPFLLEGFRALRATRDCGLWIVGDGPGRDLALAAARQHPQDIVVHGAVPHEEVPGILKAADVVVAPYTADSPLYFSPLKIVEAVAAGRPVLASRVPCVVETLGGGDLPGLFRTDDVRDFVAAAQRTMTDGVLAPDALVAQLDWEQKAARIAGWMGVECASGSLLEAAHV